MTGEKTKVVPPPNGLALSCRFYRFVFNSVLARVRFVLFPFWLLVQLCDAITKITWLLRNEYLKLKFGHCGTNVRIFGRFHVTSPDNLHVGDNVGFTGNTFLRTEGGLYIGDNTHISRDLTVYTVNHNYIGDQLPYDATRILKPVHIGRNVWIGMNVSIVPGVTIGDGAIIGMGTTVAQDVPPLAIVGSAPQRVLKMRDKHHYENLDEASRYGGMAGYPWKRW